MKLHMLVHYFSLVSQIVVVAVHTKLVFLTRQSQLNYSSVVQTWRDQGFHLVLTVGNCWKQKYDYLVFLIVGTWPFALWLLSVDVDHPVVNESVMTFNVISMLSYCWLVLQHGQCVGCQLPKPTPSLRGWQCPRGRRSSDGTTRVHYAPSVCSPTLLRHTRAARDRCRRLSPQPRHVWRVSSQMQRFV